MKSFNKWMVVPYEEKITSSEDKDLTILKDILSDKTLNDSEKYNNFNSVFKGFIDKKSTTSEKMENSHKESVNKEQPNLKIINPQISNPTNLKQSFDKKVDRLGNEDSNVMHSIQKMNEENISIKSEIEKLQILVNKLLDQDEYTEDIMNNRIGTDDSDDQINLDESMNGQLPLNDTMIRPIADSTRNKLKAKRKLIRDKDSLHSDSVQKKKTKTLKTIKGSGLPNWERLKTK